MLRHGILNLTRNRRKLPAHMLEVHANPGTMGNSFGQVEVILFGMQHGYKRSKTLV